MFHFYSVIYTSYTEDEFSLFDKQHNELYITGENFGEYTPFVECSIIVFFFKKFAGNFKVKPPF